MAIALKVQSPWPTRATYVAAAIFIAASSATNIAYGWQRGTDLATSLVWTSVAVAVSIVFSLSWPALLVALDRRHWSRVPVLLAALLVTGAYSLSAALGSASGGRTNAAAEEKSAVDVLKKAQRTYDEAQAELLDLRPSRPSDELSVLIAATESELTALPATRALAQLQQLVAQRFGQDCAAINGSLQVVCPKAGQWQSELTRALQRQKLASSIADLRAELARSDRRRQLKGEADAAAAKIERLGATKKANTDADALAMYLHAVGIHAEPDVVNRLLVLLAVVVIECGGGLALAVGMTLSDQGVRSGQMEGVNVQGERKATERPNEEANAATTPIVEFQSPIKLLERSPTPNEHPDRTAHARVLSTLSVRGGVLFGSQVALGASFGWSKTRMNEVLHELQAAGRVRLSTSRKGTTVQQVAGSTLV